MIRKILIGLGALVGLIAVGIAGLYFYVDHAVNKTYDTPLPNIQGATSPEAIARGEGIFRTMCLECHAEPGSTHAKGVHVTALPPFMGKVYSANLTSHPEAGIGSMKDEEIARMIIHAIDRNGKVKPMATHLHMTDEDVAAIIGYMRSQSPDFEPHPVKPPPTELSFLGKIVQVVVFGVHPEGRAPVPPIPKAPTVEYGKYMAAHVYDCTWCHTAGMSGNKLNEPGAYAGGFEFDLAQLGMGEGMLYSPNITPHETAGIGKWTLEQFKRALTHGIAADNSILRHPMPKYRYSDDVEIEAIYKYMMSITADPTPTKPSAMPRPKASEAKDPEQLFSGLGCTYCHGENRPFAEKIKNSIGKSPEEVAKWIRNPESFKPGTQMPSFESLLDESQAIELAKWVQAKAGGQASTPAP